MDAVYWVDGNYVPEVLAEINHFFRDWRNNQVHRIDTRTLDLMSAAHRLARCRRALQPPLRLPLAADERDAARPLAQRGHEFAAHVGQAADLRLRSRSVAQVARAAAACRAGGVGRYSRSDFTHMDCGPVRTWGT
jgi:uncharacterized protein YcbK (DUF882 family)